MSHKHSVYDNDTHFKIDPATREIENTSDKVVLMQKDHNSERFTFEIPRYIDGHDMSVCNRVEVHYNNIKADKTDTNKDFHRVDDLQISPDSEDVVICSWLIRQNATKYAGTLNFVLRFACLADDGTVDYQWFSDIYRGITVSESIYNTEAVIEEYSDILEQWKAEIDAQLEGVTGATPEQIAAAVEKYLDNNPISEGASPEQAAQIEKNRQDIQEIQKAEYATERYVNNAISNISIPEGNGAVTSVNGKTGAVTLNAEDVGALSEEALSDAVNTALEQAKESGEFDGVNGKSAYDIAVDGGFDGTKEEWLDSLKIVSKNVTIDSIAWDGMSYRDIFINGNCVPYCDFESGLDFVQSLTNSPEITDEACCSKEHSLKCFGSSSSQLVGRYDFIQNHTYYAAAKVRVVRYASGGGAGLSSSALSALTKIPSNVFVTVSDEATNASSSAINYYVGTISSADMDAYVDDVVLIDKTSLFKNSVPTKEELDVLYETYIKIIVPELAYVAPSKSDDPEICIETFVERMNKKAETLGMKNSVFGVPSGATYTENRTTARDVLRMMIEACNYSDLLKCWGKKSCTIDVEGLYRREITLDTTVTHSALESAYYILGGKTGTWPLYTDGPYKYSMVMIAENLEGKVLVGVVLGADSDDDRFAAMKSLFDIASQKLTDSTYDTSGLSIATAQSCIVCELPKYNTAMYQNHLPEILYEQEADISHNPASVTKVMTAITGLDYIETVKGKARIIPDDIQSGSGNIFYSGDIMTVESLMLAMMLPSSNTCATAFARIAGKRMIVLEE